MKRTKLDSGLLILADSTRGVLDDIWRQAYYLTSGNGTELTTNGNKVIHIRHRNFANGLFADGSCRSVDPGWIAEDAHFFWRY